MPCQLEGNLSSWKGMYLTNWKKLFQVVPCRPVKGRVSKDTRQRVWMALSPEKAAGYPDAPGPSLAIVRVVYI
jgi:hypothetical protein